MSNLHVIIIGVYTLIYLIVFFIQKSQIDKTKEIISSMKAFMEIFKIDEVRKFVDLKTERVMMEAQGMVSNHENVKTAITEITNDKVEEIKKVYLEQMGNQHYEMTHVIVGFLKQLSSEDRRRVVDEKLKNCKHYFDPILERIDKGEL